MQSEFAMRAYTHYYTRAPELPKLFCVATFVSLAPVMLCVATFVRLAPVMVKVLVTAVRDYHDRC